MTLLAPSRWACADAVYRPRLWYLWAVLSNLLLRLTWTHRLMGDLESHRWVQPAPRTGTVPEFYITLTADTGKR